jgi:hypothetical protein
VPFNGSGTFTIVNTFVPNTTILSAAVNQNFSDIATGLSDCLTRDGQAGMTAVLKAISGSVSAPGISFNSDTTAGLFLSSTGIVGLVAKSLGLLLNSSVYQVSAASVQAGGSGYAVGDTITLTGGTAITQAVLTVATLSGSAVATVTVTYPGNYTTKPSDPVSQGSTSGIGSGATFNLTWTTQFTRSVVTDESSAVPWQRLGSSSFVSGLMAKANGLDFATGIGSSALTTVIGGTFLLPPQGILSPISSTSAPIPTTDQTAVTRIYWTPYKGNVCPIYNGTSFVTTTSAQIFCDLTAGAQASGGIYDVYKFLNAGVVTLGFSPSWSAGTSGSVTAGSCARGTGAGGAALTYLNGILVNAAAMTVNNSSSTFSVPVNQGTYLGSIYVNSTAGQINCHRSSGQSRQWGLWNAYNRQTIELRESDATASWVNAPTTWRQSRGDSNNFAMLFCGLAEETASCDFSQEVISTFNNSSSNANIGIGVNSTTATSGMAGINQATGTSSGSAGSTVRAYFTQVPALGINQINALEQASAGTTNNQFNGANGMQLIVRWRG